MSNSKQVFTGTVIWFVGKLTYGFIKREGNLPDIFVHYTDIVDMTGYKVLYSGDVVTFEEGLTNNGKLKAVNVRLVERKKREK